MSLKKQLPTYKELKSDVFPLSAYLSQLKSNIKSRSNGTVAFYLKLLDQSDNVMLTDVSWDCFFICHPNSIYVVVQENLLEVSWGSSSL